MRIYNNGTYDFNGHPSMQLIEQKARACAKFDFQEINPTREKKVLESLLMLMKLPARMVFHPRS